MIEWLQNLDFVYRALMVGVCIAILGGPLGSLLIWRRLAYFGDTLAHSTLLGASLAMVLNVNLYLGLIFVAILISVLIYFFSKQKFIASDAILGIMSHTILALGLVIATLNANVRIDLLGLLYGDILAVNSQDIIVVGIIAMLEGALLFKYWPWLVSETVNTELARVEGLPVEFIRWLIIILLALVLAVAMKLVGILLITALLIIPASAARRLASSPEQMILFASIIASLAVVSGLYLSMNLDWPTGPAMVLAAAGMFALSLLRKG